MHELSLCRAIADTVVRHAAGRTVSIVRVRIGHFRQVVPDTLRTCWSFQAPSSGLVDAELEIESVPAEIACRRCGETTRLDLPVFVCSHCAATEVDLVSGEEFLIESIDVTDDTDDADDTDDTDEPARAVGQSS